MPPAGQRVGSSQPQGRCRGGRQGVDERRRRPRDPLTEATGRQGHASGAHPARTRPHAARAHRTLGVAPDGRLFRNAAGNYIEAAAYGITWRRAREATLTLDEHALALAKRPYDLRHAGISFWLASGVDPAECARRAGQSIQVLFRYYAKFLAEARNHANTLIEESMRRWVPESGA